MKSAEGETALFGNAKALFQFADCPASVVIAIVLLAASMLYCRPVFLNVILRASFTVILRAEPEESLALGRRLHLKRQALYLSGAWPAETLRFAQGDIVGGQGDSVGGLG